MKTFGLLVIFTILLFNVTNAQNNEDEVGDHMLGQTVDYVLKHNKDLRIIQHEVSDTMIALLYESAPGYVKVYYFDGLLKLCSLIMYQFPKEQKYEMIGYMEERTDCDHKHKDGGNYWYQCGGFFFNISGNDFMTGENPSETKFTLIVEPEKEEVWWEEL